MTYYDPTAMEPFEKKEIPAPASLKSDTDYALLFQHMISEFRTSINCYGKIYGYGDRQRLLASLMMMLKEVMPLMYPKYVESYPESLKKITGLVAETILMSRELTGQHPEEDFVAVG